MTIDTRKYTDFDMPTFYLDGLEGHAYVPPKSDDPEVIAKRQRYPGLAIIEDQHFGTDIGLRLALHPFENPRDRHMVDIWLGMSALNTAAFSFQYSQLHVPEGDERRHDVMRRRIKLPIIAEDEADEQWRQTPEGLRDTIAHNLGAAATASNSWMSFHRSMIDLSLGYGTTKVTKAKKVARAERHAVSSSLTCAHNLGAAAIGLAGVGLTRVRDTSKAVEIQRGLRNVAQDLVSEARQAYHIAGKLPSLALLAYGEPNVVLPGASWEVHQALEQARTQYDA